MYEANSSCDGVQSHPLSDDASVVAAPVRTRSVPVLSQNVSETAPHAADPRAVHRTRVTTSRMTISPSPGDVMARKLPVGTGVGRVVGAGDGTGVGGTVGVEVGNTEGAVVGVGVGSSVGMAVGRGVGGGVGAAVGGGVGSAVGVEIGTDVGGAGVCVGAPVGGSMQRQPPQSQLYEVSMMGQV